MGDQCCCFRQALSCFFQTKDKSNSAGHPGVSRFSVHLSIYGNRISDLQSVLIELRFFIAFVESGEVWAGPMFLYFFVGGGEGV